MLTCTTHEMGGVLVITLEDAGPAADDRGSAYREGLYKAVQSRVDKRFAVDLGRIEYMSSADIGFLISLIRRVAAAKGRIVLFDMQSYVKETLASMKLLALFTVADDLTGALLMLPSGDA